MKRMIRDGRWAGTLALALAALLPLAACEREPADADLVGAMETLLPAEPEVPAAAVEAPEHTEIVHADDLVSLVRITLAPGERVPEHEAPYRVVYAVAGSELEVQRSGEPETVPVAEGEVLILDPGIYSLTNVGETSAELVAAARTSAPLPLPVEADPVQPEERSAAGTVLLANDRVQVRAVEVGPDETVPLEPVSIRVVYTPAEDLVLEYQTAAGDTVPVSTAVSRGHARPGDDQSVAVRGADAAVQLIIFDWLT